MSETTGWMPLTAAQHGIWLGQQLDPLSPAYNIAEYVEIRGDVDTATLAAAIRRAVAETEALSVRFADGPRQLVDPPDWEVSVTDLRGRREPLTAAQRWMDEDIAVPVDLATDPLFAHAIFRLGDDHYLWYHRVHHILLDGYGLALVARRVAEVYTALANGVEPDEPGFGSLRSVVEEDAAYAESEDYGRDREFWVRYHRDRPAPATAAGRAGPLARSVVRAVTEIDQPTADLLRTVATANRANWTEVMIAASAAYLHRMTGAAQVSMAVPVMLRTGSVALRVPSMVLNVVQLWTDFTGSPSLATVTGQVSTHLRRSRRHHRYRYEQLRRDLGFVGGDRRMFGPSANIMPFDYGLRFDGHPGVVRNVSAGVVEDMAINVYDRADGDGLRIAIDGNPNLYDVDDLEGHAARFRTFLRRLLNAPDASLDTADLLLDDERELLVRTWNTTECSWPESTIGELFTARVAATPQETALVSRDQHGTLAPITYAELGRRVDHLAAELAARGAGPGTVVMLLLPRTADAVVALFAVLRCGAAYLPADPDYPPRRIAFLIADSRPRLIVTVTELAQTLIVDAAVPRLLLDDPTTTAASARGDGDPQITAASASGDGDPQITAASTRGDRDPASTAAPARRDGSSVAVDYGPDDPLCLIYTSGSTGQPKGAVTTHRGMVNLYHHHRTTMIEPETARTGRPRLRVALTAALSFDTSWEGLLWLLAGHELHFVDDDTRRDPAELLRYVTANAIDFLDITPTYAQELLTAGLLDPGRHRPAVIALGGEAAGPALWSALRGVPDISVYNLYGPTECTVDTLWARLTDCPTPVIGRPIANTRCYVLDRAMRLLPPGAVGELYLAGAALGNGYHDRPELTAQRFVADPFGPPGSRLYRTGDLARWRRDGLVEYLGRADGQVKLRGLRIELGEIEATLAGHPGVAQAAVLVCGDRLVAYIVAVVATDPPEPATLREYLAQRLPEYLVPPAYVLLDRLPVTTSGKLDRAALPDPPRPGSATSRRPETARQRLLCELFAEVLQVPEVGIDDDFFALGGHSLLAARLLGAIRSRFDLRLAIRDVFDAATVAALDRRMGGAEPSRSHPWQGVDLPGEVALDPAFTVANLLPAATGPARAVLLTGATGFLGAFLLRELLDSTTAQVHCLVRARDEAHALDRLRESLRRYGLPEDGLGRVVPVPGDLARPALGLGERAFEKLAEQVEVLLHNGARVNHLDPYTRLYAANVQGTAEVLRLAVTHRLKPVHFVSTCDTAVAADTNPPILAEGRRVTADALLANGYVASKWVAEGLVLAAGRAGLPVAVYRPSRIGGHHNTGAGSTDDALWNVIRAMLTLGAAPDADSTLGYADIVPADRAAAAIVHLMRTGRPGLTYHLTSPHPLPTAVVLDRLRRRGHPLASVTASTWARRLADAAERAADSGDYTLAVAATHTLAHGGAGAPIAFGRQNTVAGLADTGICFPRMDGAVLDAYLDHLTATGFFPAPPTTKDIL